MYELRKIILDSDCLVTGIDQNAAQTFDLILMDINLPGMDGKELTQYLRSTPEYKGSPIIAVSAAAMTKDVENASGLFEEYLTKPLNFQLLTEFLQKYLDVSIN